MKKGFQKKIFCMAVILCVLCIFGKEQITYAAENSYVRLGVFGSGKKSEIYKKYDVTGDGVADKIKISVKDVGEGGYNGRLKIYVNSKLAFKEAFADYLFWEVGLIHLKNGKTFFDISCTVASDYIALHALYECKDGKLNVVHNFHDCYGKYARYYDVRVYKVKGNKIYTSASIQFLTIGGFTSYNMKFAYKNGKIQRTSNIYPIIYDPVSAQKNKWTVNRKIKVYKKPGSKKIKYTLKKGDVIKINKVVYKGKKIFFKIKNKNKEGKMGYIPATTKYPRKMYFKESFYSG